METLPWQILVLNKGSACLCEEDHKQASDMLVRKNPREEHRGDYEVWGKVEGTVKCCTWTEDWMKELHPKIMHNHFKILWTHSNFLSFFPFQYKWCN